MVRGIGRNLRLRLGFVKGGNLLCLSSIIMSPPNGNVKMSPYEPGDIHVESEGIATSGRHRIVCEGRPGVCQSGGAARSNASADQAPQSPLSARQRSRSGSRQPRPTQPPSPARRRAPADRETGAQHLRRLQRSPSLREACRARRPFAQSRDAAPALASTVGPPRKRRAPAHRHRRVRSARLGELLQLDGSPHDWLEGRGPRLTALGMQDDATGKILAAQFFPRKPLLAISACFVSCSAALACPWPFTAIAAVSSFVTTTTGPSKNSLPENASLPSSVAPWNSSALLSLPLAAHRPRAASSVSGGAPGSSRQRVAPGPGRRHRLGQRRAAQVHHRLQPPFRRPSREQQTAWRPVPESLERICCFVHERVVSNDNVVQWEGRRFQIPQQARRFSFAGAKVQIYQALDGRLSFYYGDTRLEHAAIPGGDISMLPLG